MPDNVAVVPPAALSDDSGATLQQWLVVRGDEVYAGERVAEIVVPGILVSVSAPCSGRIEEIVAAPQAAVRPGDVLAWIVPEDPGL